MFLDISQDSQENTSASVSFLIKLQVYVCNFIKKRTLAQVFSREFWEISKNIIFHRTPLLVPSKKSHKYDMMLYFIILLYFNIMWYYNFIFFQLNFIKGFKSSFNSLLWNTIWNNWIIYYVSQARKLSSMPVNICILDMLIYICDFGIDISITHVGILMEELYF